MTPPPWLSEISVWLEHPRLADTQRYAKLQHSWHVLDSGAWDRARTNSMIAILLKARAHIYLGPGHVAGLRAAAVTAVDSVLDWLRNGAPDSDREEVVSVVAKNAAQAGSAGRAAAAGLGRSVSVAGLSAANVAWWEAFRSYAAKIQSRAASAEDSDEALETNAVDVADAAFYDAIDRVFAAVLDAIECEIKEAENQLKVQA